MLFWAGFVLWLIAIFVGDNRLMCVFGISGIGTMALAMLIEAANGRSAFDIPFFRHLGKYSYALYVIHYPISLLMSHVFRNLNGLWHPIMTAIIGIPVSYFLARFSWVLIESPFLSLKDKFKYELSSRRVAGCAGLGTSVASPDSK